MERIAQAMAAAIAPAIAEGIGGRGSQAKPSHSLPLAVVFLVSSDQIQSHRYLGALAAPIGFGDWR